jgi:long-subunit fatty acid transport protein
VATQNVLLPEFKYNWVTVGFGYMTDSFVIDFHLEYGMGQDITVELADYVPGQNMPGVHGMTIVAPSLSFTYKF